jgi:hypothetical protein
VNIPFEYGEFFGRYESIVCKGFTRVLPPPPGSVSEAKQATYAAMAAYTKSGAGRVGVNAWAEAPPRFDCPADVSVLDSSVFGVFLLFGNECGAHVI